MKFNSVFGALVIALLGSTFVPAAAATTVVSASVTTGHYYGWSLSSMSTTALLLSLPLLLFLVTLFFQSFVFLSQLATPFSGEKKKEDRDECDGNVTKNDRQFFRYMAIFWLSVTLLMYLWLLITLATFPTYYGFGGMGANWGFLLFFNIVIFIGMVWYLVYLINKARHQRVNASGSSCWRRGRGEGRRNNRSGSDSD